MNEYRNTPLWDTSKTMEERIHYALSELTLEEKYWFLSTGCIDVERLGIRRFFFGGEAAHGIEARHDQAFNAGVAQPTTTFTQPIGMSATWDTELLTKVGETVGTEARILYEKEGKMGGLSRWAPTVDMERDPRWGRNEEAYGEDPYLTGKMASAYIKGMQGELEDKLRCGATLKHFYANNVETDRVKTSSSIDPRNKQEYYLEPFRYTVVEGKAEGIMTAYNEINGIPAIVNPEIQTIAKDEWKLGGHVVCDGGDMVQNVSEHHYCDTHAQTIADGLKAGIDCFTDDMEIVANAAKEAYENGWITMEDIDRALYHSFQTKIKLGVFDPDGGPYANIEEDLLNSKKHQELALECGEKAIVLLKNDGILPIQPNKKESIAVVGPLADVSYKDWYSGIPPYHVTISEGIKKSYHEQYLGTESGLKKVKLRCERGFLTIDSDLRLKVSEENSAEIFLLNDWGFGSSTLEATSNHKLLRGDEEKKYVTASSEEAFGWFVKEAFDFQMEKEEFSFQVTSEGSNCYMVNWKDYSLYVDEEGYVAIASDSDQNNENKTLFTMELVEDGVEKACKLAKKADRTILVLGCNPLINSKEEVDRSSILLPPMQEELMKAVYQANPNTVLVLIANYPYELTWANEHMKAIVMTASGNQELGNAITAIIAGEESPAGRLNMTWYHQDQLTDMNDYDIIKQERTYQYFQGEVLYPFGYGLSYATFSYEEVTVEKEKDHIKVTALLRNLSDCDAEEVIQVYSHARNARVKTPIKKLCAFQRIMVKANQTQKVSFEIPISMLAYYDTITERKIVEFGEYDIMVGSSSLDIRDTKLLVIDGETPGYRNLSNKIKADHYDDYENIYLHRGPVGKTAVCVKDVSGKGVLIYRDCVMDRNLTTVILELMALETGSLRCYVNGKLIGEEKVAATTGFETYHLPLHQTELNQDSFELTIEIEGNLKITEFYII
jgi:beta-glucosidase